MKNVMNPSCRPLFLVLTFVFLCGCLTFPKKPVVIYLIGDSTVADMV